jgi:hypothetical protein
LYYLWSLGRFVWRREPSPSALCLLGVVGVFAAYSFTTNAFEDKGLGLVFALLIAMVVAKRPEEKPYGPYAQQRTNSLSPLSQDSTL